MRDWLERNIRGSLGAERIFQGGRHELPSTPEKGDEQPLIPMNWGGSVLEREYSIDQKKQAVLSTSLLSSETVDQFIEVLSKELKVIVDFDVGSMKWKALDLTDDDIPIEFLEDDLPEQRDFSTRSNIRISDDPVCIDQGRSFEEGPVFMDCFQGSYRALTPIGDPVVINLRSMISVPLKYDSELIGTLHLFSSRERSTEDDLKKTMDPLWELISTSLGKVLKLEAMKRERDRARDLLECTDDILILWKNNDSVWEIDCNRVAEDVIDMENISPDLMDGPFFVPPGKEWDRAVLAWNSTYDSGQPHQMDLHLRDRSGMDRSFLCKFRPIRSNGNITGVKMTGVEMDSLDDGMRQLETTNRTYRLLLSVLSHDLKNPLSAIRGYNELMEYSDDEKRKEYSKKMLSLIDRMKDTISMSSTFSQLQEGRVSGDFDDIDVEKMVNSCVEMLYPKAKEHEIRFSFQGERHTVKGHRLLEEVVINLLDNAMKFSEAGSEITVGLDADIEGIRFSVSDRGIGIPDKFKDTIFNRFSRAYEDTGIRGTGLGLAISKGITELHDGRIWVEDNPGGGSIFKVFLPWGL